MKLQELNTAEQRNINGGGLLDGLLGSSDRNHSSNNHDEENNSGGLLDGLLGDDLLGGLLDS